jgi:hypothetical protein
MMLKQPKQPGPGSSYDQQHLALVGEIEAGTANACDWQYVRGEIV